MKSWKKQLNEELDGAVPQLKESVKNAPIIVGNSDGGTDTVNGGALVKRRVKIGSVCAAFLLVLALLFLCIFGVIGRNPLPELFVFTYEINPAVAFITDKDGVVQSVKALNKDADVLLADENLLAELENAPLSEAAVAFTESAARLGYLDVGANENAVRLSGAEEDSAVFNGTADSLRSYFCENGIYAAVVQDTATVSELCERAGLAETEDMSGLLASVGGLPVFYGERNVDTATTEELNAVYESYVIGTQLLELVTGKIAENVNAIISNAQAVAKIAILNYNIMLDGDNPFSPLPADYWTVRQYPDLVYSEGFSSLMAEMENAIADYKSEFGVLLNSIEDLTSAAEAYSSLSVSDLYELLTSVTAENFVSLAEKFVDMLGNIGNDVDELKTLFNKPQTAEEYITQMRTALAELSDYREQTYSEIYGKERADLTESDYAGFISGLEEKYGSLENFWNKK